jgi:hypothetical protein
MTGNLIVMPGKVEVDVRVLRSVAREFGWIADIAHDLPEAAEAQAYTKIVAAFLHRDGVGSQCSWPEAVRLFRFVLPNVRVIACHGLSEAIDWPALREAGTFHALHLPLKENEVRQSLGFVWQAEERLAASGKNLPAVAIPALRPDTVQPNAPRRSRVSDGRLVKYAGG